MEKRTYQLNVNTWWVRALYEVAVLLVIVGYLFSILWVIFYILFGWLYQPFKWVDLDRYLTASIYYSLIAFGIVWMVVRRKARTFLQLVLQDVLIIAVGVPGMNMFLSLFEWDIDGKLGYPYQVILISALTFLLVQINHFRKLPFRGNASTRS